MNNFEYSPNFDYTEYVVPCNDCVELKEKFKKDYTKDNYGKIVYGKFHNNIKKHRGITELLKRRVKARIKDKGIVGIDLIELIGVSFNGYAKFLELFFDNNINWNTVDDWEIDHIKPLFKFNLNDKNQLLKAFHFTNTRPILKKDHAVKSAQDYAP